MKKKRDQSGGAGPGRSANYVVGQVSGSLFQKSSAPPGSSLASLFSATTPTELFQPAPKVVQKSPEVSGQPGTSEFKGQTGQKKKKKMQLGEKTEADRKLEDRELSLQNADEDERAQETSVRKRKRKAGPGEEGGAEHWAVTRQRLKARKEEEDRKRERTAFVGNLPASCTKKTLLNLFRDDGPIESIRFRSVVREDPSMSRKAAVIQRKVHPQKQSLNAYVVFRDQGGVAKAQQRNGLEIQDGFYIRVDRVGAGATHDHKRSVFVGNLAFDVEDLAFRRHFQSCGPVEGVRLIRDQNSGLGKGFGYILFESADSVQLALKLDGSKLQGRAVRVKRSVKKEKQKGPTQGRGGPTRGRGGPKGGLGRQRGGPTRGGVKPQRPSGNQNRGSFKGEMVEPQKKRKKPHKVKPRTAAV
ncbi:RNA-binding protein 34 [Antennarius striatus]|uniref:RNA-binding protein 34 n=1 Tax=Antennarius striatus TaxID=241820 RepID=UPI0035B166A8